MTKAKFKTIETTISAAVDTGKSELESLAEETREIVDNAEGGLAETQRIQTFGETADTLEGLDFPDVPDFLSDEKITYSEIQPDRKGRGLSRAKRRDNATAALDAAITAAREWAENAGDKPEDEAEDKDALEEQISAAEEFADTLEEQKDNADGVEFPGMFG